MLLKALVFGALAGVGFPARGADIPRAVPRPLPSHPGNIFLAGESVVVTAPPGPVETWRAVDYEGKTVASGPLKDGKADVGPLPVGWYKIVRGKGYITNRTFACVIEPLRAPTSRTSPVAIDVAMAWFFPKEKMGEVINVCQLAGINRVRDRLNWQEMEPKRGEFAAHNRYDDSAEIQHASGLQILQVNHLSPTWANTNGTRFARDLRDVHNFYREMASRWWSKIEAFEPWNEADIKMFGGHTGSEMATMQKAAYFGLKAGNPDVTACQNVFAIRRKSTLSDFNNNEAWPYFDTYNLHHYEPLENYPSLYADHRAVSGGRPMWVTECSVHIKWRGDENLKELGDEDLRLQSERLTKTYVLGFHEGVQSLFYFVLPHYTESKLQYGLLRPDLTPRPGYVALAAVGRWLADAKPQGRVKSDDASVQAYIFETMADGERTDVLVAWSEAGASLKLPKTPNAVFDHLGRSVTVTSNTLELTRAPIYAVLPPRSRPSLIPPPKAAPILNGKPSPVVMQMMLPDEDEVVDKSAYQMEPGRTKTIPFFIYNFGVKNASGRLKVKELAGWKVELPREVEVAVGERKAVPLTLTPPAGEWEQTDLRFEGDFGAAGRSVLSVRFVPPKIKSASGS